MSTHSSIPVSTGSPYHQASPRHRVQSLFYALPLTKVQKVILTIMSLLSIVFVAAGATILIGALLCPPAAIISLVLAGACLVSGVGIAAIAIASYDRYKRKNFWANRIAFRDLLEEIQRERALRNRCQSSSLI